MPVVALLPLIFEGIGALLNGYKFLESWQKDHPGSGLADLTDDDMSALKAISPHAHDIVTKARAQPIIAGTDITQ